MNNPVLPVLLYLLLNATLPLAGSGQPSSIPVVPYPQEVEQWEGVFPLPPGGMLPFYWPEDADTLALAQLRAEIGGRGLLLRRTSLKRAVLFCGMVTEADRVYSRGLSSDPLFSRMIGGEGYHLLITPQNILLIANTTAGLFYGVQTLRQLLRAYGPQHALPCMRITDFPVFPVRGVADHCERASPASLAFIRSQISRLAELKINYLQVNLTREAMAGEGGEVSEEWKRLLEFALRHQVRLIGSFPSPANTRHLMARPVFTSRGAEAGSSGDAAVDGGVFDFLTGPYSSMLQAYSAEFFQIRSDSQPGPGSAADREDGRHYFSHVRPLAGYLIARGRRALIRGDLLGLYPEGLDSLPPSSVILFRTRSETGAATDSLLIPFRQKGFDVIMCPEIAYAGRLLPDLGSGMEETRSLALAGYGRQSLGLITSAGSGDGGYLFTPNWYGLAYAAEQSWHPCEQPLEDFGNRLSRGWLADPLILLPKLLETLQELSFLDPTLGMNQRVLHQAVLSGPDQGIELDTAGWKAAADISRRAERLLRVMENQASGYLRQDLSYWSFIVQLYRTLAEAPGQLLSMGNAYRMAEARYGKEPGPAGELLDQVLHQCVVLTDRWDRLLYQIQTMWEEEYGEHGLVEALGVYAFHLRNYQRLLVRLSLLRSRGHQGEADPEGLPSRRSLGLDIKAKEK